MTGLDNETTAVGDESLVRIATVGAAHGLRGEVRLRLHTDDPDGRLRTGAEFATDPAEAGPLHLAGVRVHQDTYLVRFAQHQDRTGAQSLTGVVLLAPPQSEPDAWYPHQLRGLTARAPDGTHLGTVAGVEHMPAHDVLVLRQDTGPQVLVPFVHAIVPEVDVAAGYLVIDAPGGLLEEQG